ncbi:type II toxin-antitoxin system CcdA family antitoxin [Pseudochrobactrum kiredjianiae]|uniref:Type II toxin-antitoxin system CcdA family antitoxin n=1 Tax=Pseudochrobactrum kiredjianiae TaxID=386305 RepID=A0ABW3V4C8_9HYPH
MRIILVKIENAMPENQSENLIKRAPNLTIDRALHMEARSYKRNISRAAEIGIAQAIIEVARIV